MVEPLPEMLDRLRREHEENIRVSFLEAFAALVSSIVMTPVVRDLTNRDVPGAVSRFNLEPGFFTSMARRMDDAYFDAGLQYVDRLPKPPGSRVPLMFGIRKVREDDYLLNYSGAFVDRLLEEQKTIIRERLMAELEAGESPQGIVRRLVGGLNLSPGRRSGGYIGLNAPQASFVARARTELRSNESDQLQNYLQRRQRDKKFDLLVKKALKDKTPLTASSIEAMVGHYADNLLRFRARTVAASEARTAISVGMDDVIRQQLESGRMSFDEVKKRWVSKLGPNVRHTHRILHGQEVYFGDTFLSPSGARLRYPHDPKAPASEVIDCQCHVDYRVEYLEKVRRKDGLR